MPAIFTSFDPPTRYFELAELPLTPTALTGEMRLTLIFISGGDNEGTITITNTAGKFLAKATIVPANTPLPALEFPFMYVNGLIITPSVAGISVQVEGYPNV